MTYIVLKAPLNSNQPYTILGRGSPCCREKSLQCPGGPSKLEFLCPRFFLMSKARTSEISGLDRIRIFLCGSSICSEL